MGDVGPADDMKMDAFTFLRSEYEGVGLGEGEQSVQTDRTVEDVDGTRLW